jgi:uncharacterized BrkB/YihY/UPF0761 family membrane protein
MATPFIFVAQSCSISCCASLGPSWWHAIDYVFIAITFMAVYTSARRTNKHWMTYAMYSSWSILTGFILNEKAMLFPIPEVFKYLSAFALVGLHLYNRKYCQCETQCCVD